MPRFYFNFISPGHYTMDEVGGEFPDVEAAYLDAWQAALELVIDMLRERRDPFHCQFDITDSERRCLLEIPFSEVMRPSAQPTHRHRFSADLCRRIARSRELYSDIKDEFGKARLVLDAIGTTLQHKRAAE
jgi:hypothetical protein